MSEEKQCVLVIVGADEFGRKQLLAMTDGFRESTQSWRELLLDLKRRGLKQDPKLTIGDGLSGSGPPCAKCSPRRMNNGAGSTRR